MSLSEQFEPLMQSTLPITVGYNINSLITELFWPLEAKIAFRASAYNIVALVSRSFITVTPAENSFIQSI